MAASRKHIFIIDDQPIANFITKRMLEMHDGSLTITEFTDATLAISNMEATPPDLIFLDLSMPVMDGWDFLNAMQEKGIHIPVVILTSSSSDTDIEKSKTYTNVIHYSLKPIIDTDIQTVFEKLA